MPKKQSKSNIPLGAISILESQRSICEVCESYIDDDTKLLVWDNNGDVFGWACIFCKSIYSDDDELASVGIQNLTIGQGDIIGEA